MTKRAIVVTSGGMDSTAALYLTRNQFGDQIGAISFNYGQRHNRELKHAQRISEHLGIEHHIVDISGVTSLLTTSALTNKDIDVPEGHYEEDTMKITVVPNRNMMMASIAAAWAVAEGAECIVMGMHAGDHAVYPDCRPAFASALSSTIFIGNEGNIKENFTVWTPFIDRTKAEIVTIGEDLGVPWEMTWTCYKGGEEHCGRCSTCVERLEAFYDAGVEDRVKYTNTEYWKEVCGVS